MPDFDSFERIFKSTMEGTFSPWQGASQISQLPDPNKVQLVKGRTQEEINEFLIRARNSLRGFFPGGATFTSSGNNQVGKDLFEVNSKTHIELKSGSSMTDANSGIAIVSWALEDTDMRLTNIMSGGMRERRALLLDGSSSFQIMESKSQTMNSLYDFFHEKLEIGPAPLRFDHFLRSVANGVTKAAEIKEYFDLREPQSAPLMLEADWTVGLRLYDKGFLTTEVIDVVKIERTTDRAQIVAIGSKSGRVARLYPNYKNSWTSRGGTKFEASNWVQTACFHVWID